SQPSNIADGSRRAKQAFGNSATAAAGDRYGENVPQMPDSNAGPKTAVNPFGPAPGGGSLPTNSKGDAVQPLSANPNDSGTPSREFSPSGDGMRPLDNSHAARTGNRDMYSKSRNASAAPGNIPSADASPFPTPAAPHNSAMPGAIDGPTQPL